MRIRGFAPLAGAVALSLAFAGTAPAGPITESKKLREAVTLEGIAEHEQKFQQIANAHQGNRAAGTVGYEASVAYVRRTLEDAGYRVRLEPFDFPLWEENSTPVLEQVTPAPKAYVAGTPADSNSPDVDFITISFSGSGDVTAPVVPTNDVVIPPGAEPNTSTSGCEPEDFPAETEGSIALVQRGTCPFVQKLDMAAEAGAAGVILFNEGQAEPAGRQNPLFVGASPYLPIPAVFSSFAVGQELYDAYTAGQEPTVHLAVDATTTPRVQHNVIADSRHGDPDRTVVVGGHLDSVPAGPGINDNGSGTATILETAEQIADLGRKPRNQLRFAFWGTEEAGLIGSTAYVAQLTEAERDDILLNLNFDMLASPNFVRFVYDGNTDETPPPPGGAPPGSDVIEQEFLDYFQAQGLPTEPTAFDGRSDYGPFIAQGIPAGGLFTGAEVEKTPEQVAVYGGVAGEQYDPCYHEECDTLDSVFGFPPGLPALDGNGALVLDQMADSVAHATWHFALDRTELGGATQAQRPERLRAYRLPYRGPERNRRR